MHIEPMGRSLPDLEQWKYDWLERDSWAFVTVEDPLAHERRTGARF